MVWCTGRRSEFACCVVHRNFEQYLKFIVEHLAKEMPMRWPGWRGVFSCCVLHWNLFGDFFNNILGCRGNATGVEGCIHLLLCASGFLRQNFEQYLKFIVEHLAEEMPMKCQRDGGLYSPAALCIGHSS